jgi:P27 family predicted phage terminase small subunit
MGKRGPAPKPTNLRVLHGDRRDRINTREPQPREALPEPPERMSPGALVIWEYTIEELASMRTITAADRDALACYCEAVATHRRASELLARSDILMKALHGDRLVRNPLLAVQRDAAYTIRQFAGEFGLTPSARSSIRVGQRNVEDVERLLS